jgi:exopolyphosphatase/guanosine-5'-triphosphate,3'-diphosphate pyrophosphatase
MDEAAKAKEQRERGIGYWMERVVAEAQKTRADFAADPVHDLRVALRRCRSMAESFRAVDPDPAWNKMRKAGKAVFSALGELRDCQVLMEWIAKLSGKDDAAGGKLMAHCRLREQQLKSAAAEVLAGFDARQWIRWAQTLETRARRIEGREDVFQVLALEKWQDARQLHSTALRNRSKVAFHQLRIGIKKFRYVVENFLPRHHAMWSADLKTLQDELGDVHDLDVLWATACATHVFVNDEERSRWNHAVSAEREKRVREYRDKMLGPASLWRQWRDGLLQGDDLRRAVLKRFEIWTAFLDDDQRHAKHVLRLSLQLYDGLRRADVLKVSEYEGVTARELLTVASRAHNVGAGAGTHAHHKRARRMLEKLEPPPGWTPEHLSIAGLIGRYHRGALPGTQASYNSLPAPARAIVDALAGILRLADRLDETHDQSIKRIRVERNDGFVMIEADGYRELTRSAEHIAAARHLLETVCGLPILIRPGNAATTPAVKKTTPRQSKSGTGRGTPSALNNSGPALKPIGRR